MKPFIKPRPATPPQPEPAAPKPAASLNELTIFALAAGISDPTERTAYLDQRCGADAALKARLQQRLAARLADIPAPPAPTAERRIESALLSREPSAKDSPALALVPVSAMQFPALPPQLQRQVTFAWGSATLMALAVGALAVIFYFEKDARVRAEGLAKEATGAAEQSLRDRESSEARAREAATEAQRTADARDKAEAERDASALKAAAAAQETERLRAEADKQRAELNSLRTSTEEKSKAEKEQMLATQRTATSALADSLATLANFQLLAKAYADAEVSARQCFELRSANGIQGWPLVEARSLLGEASLQRNADAEAEKMLTAAGTEIETLGAPTNDIDRARFTSASKRIVLFFNATGRRKEGTEWKRRLDAIVAPRQP